jgi:hypothetical protein
MSKHYDVYNLRTSEVVTEFELLKDAELWIAEQEIPGDYETIAVEVTECNSPMNLFLSHGTLTRNKK